MSIPPTATLQRAIETARGMGAKHWIIQTDEVREPELWGASSLDRITVLTGGDEAALVACYRALKGIAQSTDQHQTLDIHVAVMGVSPEKASHAIERVTRAGEKFLARQITGSSPASKIGAGTASVLFRSGSDTPNLTEVMSLLSPDVADTAVPTATAAPAPGIPEADRAAAVDPAAALQVTREETVQRELAAMRNMLLAQPLNEEQHEAAEELQQHHADDSAAVSEYPAQQIELRTTDEDSVESLDHPAAAHHETPEPQQVHPQPPRPASLIDFIDDVEPLSIECPGAGAVEFGVAQDGRLHLVAHVDGEQNSGKPSTQAKVLEDLLVASAWAVAHARMLLRSHSSLRLGADHKPVLHVVTDKPRESRRLLDTEVRVHLVVKSDIERPWISMELN